MKVLYSDIEIGLKEQYFGKICVNQLTVCVIKLCVIELRVMGAVLVISSSIRILLPQEGDL